MERARGQHCIESAGLGSDPNTLGSILGKNRSIWFSNRCISCTLYKGLTQLYGELYIANGVWEELNARGKRWPGSDETAAAAWIHRHAVQNQGLVNAYSAI